MRDPSKPVPRGVYILPNLFTTASLFAGFLSITMAFAGNFDDAAWAILFSALMDGLDGKVARLTGSASQFGVEYDSLADAIAFGVAPGVLARAWQLHHFGRLGLAAAFLFAACGALRLARFNVSVATTSKRFFIGLPIPAGGCTFATFVLFLPHLPEFMLGAVPHMALGLSFLAPLLMVSRVRYFSFKEYGFVKAHPFSTLVSALLIFVLLFSMPRLWAFLACLGYILSGLIYTFLLLPRRNKQILHHLTQQNS